MLTEKSKNLIKEGILSLPKEAQEAINSLDWEKISEEIGKTYLLDEGEIETLQLETASFLLGLVDEDAYPRNIEDEVGTSKDEANKIAKEVFQKIFTPINDTLIENIKKSGKDKNPNAEQNLNFILSGGNYSTFMEERINQMPETSTIPVNSPSLRDIKDNVTKTNI